MISLFKQFIEHKITKHALLIIAMLAIIFLAIWARAFIGSMKDFAQGEVFFRDKQYIKAVTFFDRSMHWYMPFNPYIERSAEYLWKISNRAEEINDDQLSLIAIETIRNSFYSSRSFYSPGVAWIKRCDDKIYNLTRSQNKEMFKNGDLNEQYKTYRQDMTYNDPILFWTIVLEIGLFGWIGAIIGFIFFYLGSCLKTDKYVHTYWFWMLLAAISYSLWILGMIKA